MKNRLRKIFLYLILLVSVCMLSGCQDAIPEMSDAEMNQVEEYAAHLLLKYDKNYSSSVLSDEEKQALIDELEAKAKLREQVLAQKEAEELAKQEEAEAENNSSTDASEDIVELAPTYASIAEFLELENISIDYVDSVVTQTYPVSTEENDWQGLAVAGRGNNIVVYEFNVTNYNDYDYNLDIKSMKLKASVKINGSVTKAPITTMLTNDFIFYNDVIPANGTVTLVILIELPEEDSDNINSAVLTLKNGTDKITTSLL